MNKKENFIFKGVNNEELKDHQSSVWTNVYKQVINDQSVVYDIGAFRGVTVRGFANLGCEVHAFEGSPRNYDYLVENTKNLKNIICHKVGLHTSNYTTKTRFNDCLGYEHPEQLINYVRLDDYVTQNEIKDPDYIKMDIEGMESIVMLTCTRFIAEVKPIWQLSLHQNFPGYGEDYPGWISSELRGFDFALLFDFYRAYTHISGQLNEVKELVGVSEFLLIPK